MLLMSSSPFSLILQSFLVVSSLALVLLSILLGYLFRFVAVVGMIKHCVIDKTVVMIVMMSYFN